jgi:hypothetical protein
MRGQLLAINVSPDLAQGECDAATNNHSYYTLGQLSKLTGQPKGLCVACRALFSGTPASLPEINARLADQLVSLNGKLEFPRKFVLERFAGMRL